VFVLSNGLPFYSEQSIPIDVATGLMHFCVRSGIIPHQSIHMKNLPNNFKRLCLFILFTTVFISCRTTKAPEPHLAFEQYGTPFAGVPERQDVAIYQVNIRAFSQEGSFNGVLRRLDSIKALGTNVIYLMPIYPVGQVRSAGGMGSPYAVRDFKAVNPEFGTLEHLRNLVSEAHKRGMAVILDWVPNHTSWDNEWITAHKDWYQQDGEGNIIIPPGTNWRDVAQLNHNNPEMRKAMIEAMTYWVYTANIDGFRCDAADYVPFSFWKEAVDSLRAISTHKLLLMAEGARNDHIEAGFDFTFGFDFFHTLSEDVFKANKSVTMLTDVHAKEYPSTTGTERVVRYTTNHDVNLTNGTPQELFGGKQGALAAFVVAAYMRSVPMIYNGQEIGHASRLQFFSRTPINWSAADLEVLAEYKKLIAFYNSSNAIRNGDLTSYHSDDVAVFTREVAGEKVLVLSNLRNRPVNYTVPAALINSSWADAFSGSTEQLAAQVSLQPFGYIVLQSR
jgi:glycosidase